MAAAAPREEVGWAEKEGAGEVVTTGSLVWQGETQPEALGVPASALCVGCRWVGEGEVVGRGVALAPIPEALARKDALDGALGVAQGVLEGLRESLAEGVEEGESEGECEGEPDSLLQALGEAERAAEAVALRVAEPHLEALRRALRLKSAVLERVGDSVRDSEALALVEGEMRAVLLRKGLAVEECEGEPEREARALGEGEALSDGALLAGTVAEGEGDREALPLALRVALAQALCEECGPEGVEECEALREARTGEGEGEPLALAQTEGERLGCCVRESVPVALAVFNCTEGVREVEGL